jgi:adenylate kinase
MNNPNISRSAWLQGPSAPCSVQPEANHPWRLILRGAPGVGKGTVALDYMRRGALVPDSTVWEMVRERAGCLRCRGGFILDGFPRTLSQAESLAQLMKTEGWSLVAVVNYELPIAEIVDRLSERRTCDHCKTVYPITGKPSQTAAICDRCGGRLYQREDDRTESVTVRMDAYQRSTAPLIDFYRRAGLLLSIEATGSPEAICERTLAALSARNQNSVT